jgi:hypothetical protein
MIKTKKIKLILHFIKLKFIIDIPHLSINHMSYTIWKIIFY